MSGNSMISIKEFFRQYKLLEKWETLAVANCSDMKDVWEKSPVELFLTMVYGCRLIKYRDNINFSEYCVESVRHLVLDKKLLLMYQCFYTCLKNVSCDNMLGDSIRGLKYEMIYKEHVYCEENHADNAVVEALKVDLQEFNLYYLSLVTAMAISNGEKNDVFLEQRISHCEWLRKSTKPDFTIFNHLFH